jgi:hypothetical protein
MKLSDKISSRRQFLKSSSAMTAGVLAAPYILTGCSSRPEATDAAEEEGFVSLFDGESLEGWHTNPQEIGHGTGGQWTIEDGAIVSRQDPPDSGNGGILLTDREYGDFELLIDIDPDWGPDSGVFLRSTERGECFQVYVDYHDDAIIGFIYGEGTGAFRTEPFRYDGVLENGELVDLAMRPYAPFEGYARPQYACTAEEWRAAWKIGEFNTLRIRCEGEYPLITTWINGQKIVEFDAATHEHPDYDREEVMQKLGTSGHIALQVHGGSDWWPAGSEIRWRNIQIKEL